MFIYLSQTISVDAKKTQRMTQKNADETCTHASTNEVQRLKLRGTLRCFRRNMPHDQSANGTSPIVHTVIFAYDLRND